MSTRLISGKNDLQRIVSLEVKDGTVEIFTQEADGSIKSTFKPHKYWILSHLHHRNVAAVLEGNQHFKYMSIFNNMEDWTQFKYRNQRLDLYSIYNQKEACMVREGYTYCKGLKPNEISILSFDIETNGLKQHSGSRVYMISNTYRSAAGQITKRLFSFDEYKSDGEMIEDWCKWVREMDPSFLVGHNIFSYDLPMIDYVASLTGHSLKLGRDGSRASFSTFESKYRLDGTRDLKYNKCNIYGREIIDTMFLAYKYDIGKKYENYKLKNIISQEGLEKEGRTFYDAAKIKDNIHIPEELKKIKEYCIDDSDDALALYDLMIPPYFYMGQSVPKSMQEMICTASGGQLNSVMVRAYLQDGHSIPQASEVFRYQGAISFGVPGIYKNVWKVDVKSEYPSCILQYNICDKQKDPKQYFLKMVDYFTNERFKNKDLAEKTGDKYYTHLEQSQKVFINSAYGFMGAAGLNFNSPVNAALVTEKGREVVTKAIEWASGKSPDYWMNIGDKDE